MEFIQSTPGEEEHRDNLSGSGNTDAAWHIIIRKRCEQSGHKNICRKNVSMLCGVCVRTITHRENSQGLEMQLSGRGPTQNVYDTGLDPTHKTDKQQNTEISYIVPQL